MAKRVIFLVGLPGSGKSHLAKEIIRFNPEYVLIDDPLKGEKDRILEPMSEGKSMVICDPWLCDANAREVAQKLFEENDYMINWYYFENDVDKCKANIAHRNDGRVVERFEPFNYTIPEGIQTIAIWQLEEKI